MRTRVSLVILIASSMIGCGSDSLESAVEDIRSAAEDFCDCLPNAEQSTCLSAVSSLESFTSCVDTAVEAAGTSADVEGFVNCYQNKADAAESCINGSSACDPGRVDMCIEVSGIYNCMAPEMIRATIQACT
jgi:hypothetical protein